MGIQTSFKALLMDLSSEVGSDQQPYSARSTLWWSLAGVLGWGWCTPPHSPLPVWLSTPEKQECLRGDEQFPFVWKEVVYLWRELNSHHHFLRFSFETRSKSCLSMEGGTRLLTRWSVIPSKLGMTSLGIWRSNKDKRLCEGRDAKKSTKACKSILGHSNKNLYGLSNILGNVDQMFF